MNLLAIILRGFLGTLRNIPWLLLHNFFPRILGPESLSSNSKRKS